MCITPHFIKRAYGEGVNYAQETQCPVQLIQVTDYSLLAGGVAGPQEDPPGAR